MVKLRQTIDDSMDREDISLNKYLSEKGLCSRREADIWIEAGRLKLNGIVAKKGNRVGPGDIVLLDDLPLQQEKPSHVYIALHKPRGIVCTTDLDSEDNIIDYIQYHERIFPIGRLDKYSEGLILLTNNGDIVNKILRSRYFHEKEYLVRVDKSIHTDFLKGMSNGVPILDTVTRPCKVFKVNENTFKIILTQGLNRQIRRMCTHFGYNVTMLRRIRIMSIRLDDLPYGQWRLLTDEEISILIKDTKSNV